MKFFKPIITAALIAGITVSAMNILQAAEKKVILKIDDPMMTVNGEQAEIDPGVGTAPMIAEGRTLVPIRAIIEALGGSAAWDAESSTAVLTHGKNEIKLTPGSKTAYVNGSEKTLDTEPIIVNGRTMLPLRFISEGFGFGVEWDGDTKTITVTQTDEEAAAVTEPATEKTEPATEKAETATEKDETESGTNTLVVYFTRPDNIAMTDDLDAVSSASLNKTESGLKGNTRIVAENICEKVGGDIVNIEAKELYPSDYNAHTEYADSELSKKARPEIKTHIDDMDKYDTVYICYPIWWGTMPMPVYTFIEAHNFDGKTVIPVSTSGGSGMGSTQQDIEKLMPNANVLKGFSVSGSNAADSKSDVEKALNKLSK